MLQFVSDREADIDFGDNGVKLTKPREGYVRKDPLAGKRGGGSRTDGVFKRAAVLRLRKKLACLPSDTFRLFGLTLTMPAQCYAGPADFRKLWNTFTYDVTLRLRGVRGGGYSPDIGFVWRIEMTEGKNEGKIRTPHMHLVAWTNAPADILWLGADWCAAVERHYKLKRGSLDPQVAALGTELTSCQAAFQYVANHTSKHKKGQLGWPGRQWGIYYGTRENRKKMSPILNRFDDVPVHELREKSDLNNAQSAILAHGNTKSVKMARICNNCTKEEKAKTNKKNAAFWKFLRVCRRLIESQLGRMAENARVSYYSKKYGTRARCRYWAYRYARNSVLFFSPDTLKQLRNYWEAIA